MKREEGFYWLRSKKRWSIGRFHGADGWTIIGHDGYGFEDSDFEEIDERRIERVVSLVQQEEDRFSKNPPQYLSDNPYLCKE